MQSRDARILRAAAISTAVVTLIAAVLAGVTDAGEGVLGALLAGAVVIGFFALGKIAVASASRMSPQMMMQVALFTYLAQVLVLFGLIVALRDATFFAPKAFAWTVVAGALVWIGAEIRASGREKMLYVEPGPVRND